MKKHISIALALLLLFSSIGLAKSTHICMGSEMMHEFGLAVKHLHCGMELTQTQQDNSPSAITSDDCCENQFELLQNETERNHKILNLEAPSLIFVAAFTQVFIFGVSPIQTEEYPTSDISPPLIAQDYTILYQTFLI